VNSVPVHHQARAASVADAKHPRVFGCRRVKPAPVRFRCKVYHLDAARKGHPEASPFRHEKLRGSFAPDEVGATAEAVRPDKDAVVGKAEKVLAAVAHREQVEKVVLAGADLRQSLVEKFVHLKRDSGISVTVLYNVQELVLDSTTV
jgi:hypothetical protein